MTLETIACEHKPLCVELKELAKEGHIIFPRQITDVNPKNHNRFIHTNSDRSDVIGSVNEVGALFMFKWHKTATEPQEVRFNVFLISHGFLFHL